MAKKIRGPRVVTANRLHDGLVVFLRDDGSWSRDLDRARVAADDNEAEALSEVALAAARSNIIVDPYPVAVDVTPGQAPVPVAHRERLRASGGPTVGNSIPQVAEQPNPSSLDQLRRRRFALPEIAA